MAVKLRLRKVPSPFIRPSLFYFCFILRVPYSILYDKRGSSIQTIIWLSEKPDLKHDVCLQNQSFNRIENTIFQKVDLGFLTLNAKSHILLGKHDFINFSIRKIMCLIINGPSTA